MKRFAIVLVALAFVAPFAMAGKKVCRREVISGLAEAVDKIAANVIIQGLPADAPTVNIADFEAAAQKLEPPNFETLNQLVANTVNSDAKTLLESLPFESKILHHEIEKKNNLNTFLSRKPKFLSAADFVNAIKEFSLKHHGDNALYNCDGDCKPKHIRDYVEQLFDFVAEYILKESNHAEEISVNQFKTDAQALPPPTVAKVLDLVIASSGSKATGITDALPTEFNLTLNVKNLVAALKPLGARIEAGAVIVTVKKFITECVTDSLTEKECKEHTSFFGKFLC